MNDDARDSSASRGSHGDAIGWVMFKNGALVLDVVFTDRDEAEKYCLGAYSGTAEVVGVYRQPQPTLTDEERRAITEAIEEAALDRVAAVLKQLLQRLQ